MEKKFKELSVFFPAYNEEQNITETVKKAKEVLEKLVDKWEINVIDDGSSDATATKVEALGKSDKRIRVTRHKVNQGYGGALKTGFETAKYEWVAFSDSDGQFDFGEIERFIEKTPEAEFILGYRIKRADPLIRKIFTWGWNLFPRIVLGMKAKDYSCGFKMLKKSVYEKIQPLLGEEKVTQIEMIVKAQRMGVKFAEVGVHHYPREKGQATGARLSVVLKSVSDIFKLYLVLKR